MAHVFYNTFFNLEKYLDNEQRDPFAVQKVWIIFISKYRPSQTHLWKATGCRENPAEYNKTFFHK